MTLALVRKPLLRQVGRNPQSKGQIEKIWSLINLRRNNCFLTAGGRTTPQSTNPKKISTTIFIPQLTSGIKCDKFVADDNEPAQTQTRPPLEEVHRHQQGESRQAGCQEPEGQRMEVGVPEAGERVGGVKTPWKKFWFESGFFFGWIESMDDWQRLRSEYPDKTDDQLLAAKEFPNSRTHNYGFLHQHTGPRTLADFFREHGMRIEPVSRRDKITTFLRRRIWFGFWWGSICSIHGDGYRHSCRMCRAGLWQFWTGCRRWFGRSGPRGER